MYKILVVEDHPAQRDILAQLLKLGEFEVAVAGDGREGVEKARSWLPDLILMNLRMPIMDGFEAIRAIRADGKTTDVPIIVISGWVAAVHKKAAFAAGADDFFSKPADLNRLLRTIGRYLSHDIPPLQIKEHHRSESAETETKE